MAVLVGNDGLTPNTLDPNAFFPRLSAHNSDSRSPVSDYKKAVQMVLENPADRANLIKALQDFQTTMVVEDLIDKLQTILDAPNRRILYKYISPLIPSRLRAEYKSSVPHVPGFEKKMIRLKQTGNQPFGFSVRGGKEFGCGIYVVKVMSSSKAAQNGLKPGDQVVRVNGLTLSECTHKEFVELVKLRKSLALAVKTVGLIPEVKQPGKAQVTWKEVGEAKSWVTTTRIGIHGPIRSTRRIHVTLQKGESLGANVKISSAIDAGVFIVDVTPNSPAFVAGLKPGNEILEVNNRSLIGKSHDQAIAILKSNNTLMMTIRADKVMSRESTALSDLEYTSHEHDTDAQVLSNVQYLSNETFVLREREEQPKKSTKKNQMRKKMSTDSGNRISVFDTEVQQSHTAPIIASQAAFGHGPTLAMPTLLGMGQQMARVESVDFSDVNFPLTNSSGLMEDNRQSRPLSDQQSRPLSDRQPISVSPVPIIGQATVDGDKAAQKKVSASESQQQDLSSFQFPVDDENDDNPKNQTRQASDSAMKKPKSIVSMKERKPKFSEDVEIIPENRNTSSSMSTNSIISSVHPSNYTFSDEILNGRSVVFHTIPKDGPLRLAIRGGRDTPLGPQIIISRIIEDGAAARYGKLNVGDQILVIDGISLIDVSHDEAAQAFKRAMEMESVSIDLVVAVNPEKQS